MDKAVIYCRTGGDNSQFSLLAQQKRCADYCRTHGLRVTRVFLEEGKSGNDPKRPQLLKLLSYCQKNKDRIGFVIVHDATRLARGITQVLKVRAKLARY